MGRVNEFLLSAWQVAQCDRLKAYGRPDYDKRIFRLEPGDDLGGSRIGDQLGTPPDVGFVGKNYAGILILGLNPGRGRTREKSERAYFSRVVQFRQAKDEKAALKAGRRVLTEERKSARTDPWPFYRDFVLPLLALTRGGSGSVTVDNIARLNIARSKTVDDSVNLTRRMAKICFNAHGLEQLALIHPKVIVCRYKQTADWLSEWAPTVNAPVAVVGGRGKPSHAALADAARTIERALGA